MSISLTTKSASLPEVEAKRVARYPLRLPELDPLDDVPLDEERHLHLLKLARAGDAVSGCDLVAERRADLYEAERTL